MMAVATFIVKAAVIFLGVGVGLAILAYVIAAVLAFVFCYVTAEDDEHYF